MKTKIETLRKKIREIQLAESRAKRKARNRAVYIVGGAVLTRLLDPQTREIYLVLLSDRDRAAVESVLPPPASAPVGCRETTEGGSL